MSARTGCGLLALALAGAGLQGQTLTNKSLSGKYFFRQVSLGTDSAGKLTDPRSALGTITFDGAGGYVLAGQEVQGTSAAVSLNTKGTYAVDPAGFVTVQNPLRSGTQIDARFGPEALIGSSTEAAGDVFDLFAAVAAPASGVNLAGPYWIATLEFPGGSAANVRSTFFSLNNQALGTLAPISAQGHAANVSGGLITTQQVTGATFTLGNDGSGSFSFGTASSLLSGTKTFYISADGNLIVGGSTAAGSHDFLIGVKAMAGASNASWSGNFWTAGLRWATGDGPDATGYAGATAARGAGRLTLTRRVKSLASGTYDFTATNGYALKADGSGAVELTEAAVGAGGKAYVGAALNNQDTGAYEVYVGVQMAPLSGTPVFVNPQGIANAASFAPAGNPISPGEFIAIFGTGLASQTGTAAPPYPASLDGVSVTIQGRPAPVYFVSPRQINCLVPYGTQGPAATVVVHGSATSNTVTVRVAATSPGIYSLDNSGSGAGAVLHADYSVVNGQNPAAPGETVMVFLTGMGAVTPAAADGTAGGTNPLNRTTASPIYVWVAGEQAQVQYSGLAPGFPGLYQINVTLPPYVPRAGSVPLAIGTPNAYHDQVSIAVAPPQ